jgi:hypothetical protein
VPCACQVPICCELCRSMPPAGNPAVTLDACGGAYLELYCRAGEGSAYPPPTMSGNRVAVPWMNLENLWT